MAELLGNRAVIHHANTNYLYYHFWKLQNGQVRWVYITQLHSLIPLRQISQSFPLWRALEGSFEGAEALFQCILMMITNAESFLKKNLTRCSWCSAMQIDNGYWKRCFHLHTMKHMSMSNDVQVDKRWWLYWLHSENKNILQGFTH